MLESRPEDALVKFVKTVESTSQCGYCGDCGDCGDCRDCRDCRDCWDCRGCKDWRDSRDCINCRDWRDWRDWIGKDISFLNGDFLLVPNQKVLWRSLQVQVLLWCCAGEKLEILSATLTRILQNTKKVFNQEASVTHIITLFLAVQNSSIGDLVPCLLGWSVCYH